MVYIWLTDDANRDFLVFANIRSKHDRHGKKDAENLRKMHDMGNHSQN